MVGNRGSSAFTDQIRVGNLFLAADFRNGADDIPRIFRQGVVHRAFGIGTRTVVIDGQSPSHIEVGGFESEVMELSVKTGGFPHGSTEGQNIRDLRSNMEMEHLQSFGTSFLPEVFNGFQEFSGGESEFSAVSTGKGPFADPAGGKPHPNPNQRLDLHRPGGFDRQFQLFRLFNHEDDLFPKFATHEGGANEFSILISVADQQAFRIPVLS